MTDRGFISLAEEIAFGESQELRIIRRWSKLSKFANLAAFCVKSGRYHDFDFILLDKIGMPVVWVEVKKRKSPLSRFGDCLFPERKHIFAKRLLALHNITLVGVTEYGCGSLVEVDLSVEPAKVWNDFKRHDRKKTVPHVIYEKHQLTILEAR